MRFFNIRGENVNKQYVIFYISSVFVIVLALILFPDMNEQLKMFLFGAVIVLTSIFTYSTRRKQ